MRGQPMTRQQLDRIKKMHSHGYPSGQIAAAVGVDPSTVRRVIRGDRSDECRGDPRPYRRKVGEAQAQELRDRHLAGETMVSLARETGIAVANVRRAIERCLVVLVFFLAMGRASADEWRWNMQDDAASGTVAGSGEATNGTLSSGNTKDISVAGPGGLYPKALHLSSGLRVAVTNFFTQGVPTDSLTVAAWVNFRSAGNNPDFITCHQGSGNPSFLFRLNGTTRRPQIYIRPVGLADMTLNIAEDPLELETWHHVAFTFDGTAVVLYVDGEQANSQSFSSATEISDNASSNHNFGARNNGTNPSDVYLAGVVMFDAPLSAGQIEELYLEGFDAPDAVPLIIIDARRRR